ncbi:MAG: hypothetical protein Ct9H300mP28_32450 [Pseudomonadota bacterium]|nr:MAG: hypothetical protein Ct9H300mP28_32450 [Pseudomonadota bacterium]
MLTAAVIYSHLTHYSDYSARIVLPWTTGTGKALGTVPDTVIKQFIKSIDVFAGHDLCEYPWTKIVEACGGTGSNADATFVAAYSMCS